MRLDDNQLKILRSRPQKTTLSLFIYKPEPVLKCMVNSPSIQKGARTIPFNNITLGGYSDVVPDMTLLVGTTEGGHDVGRVRVRYCRPGILTVGENSDIGWKDGLYLTVVKLWEVWPVHPRIIQNPNNETDVIFYKDYDIPHVNQNNALGTFLCAGTHQGIVLESGTGTVYYSATGSSNLKGSGISYQWSFEGGHIPTSTDETPGNVYYTTPGDYVTKLLAVNGDGSTDLAYRYICVRDKLGYGDYPPIQRWTMGEFTESRSEGGGSIEFTVFDPIEDLAPGTVVILRSDDWYGANHISLGGNVPNSESIFFVGFIDSGTISYNAFNSSVSFVANSITQLMKRVTGFSVSVESKPSATSWFTLLDMDIPRAIYHYLKWHSTALTLADFHFVGDDRRIQYFDADRGSLYDAVNTLAKTAMWGSFSADRQGGLWVEVQPQATLDPTGTYSQIMNIQKLDWKDRPVVTDRYYTDVSYMELGGIAYSGSTTGTFSAYLADAPGGSPARAGNVESDTGMALFSQDHLNRIVGHIWANRNCDFPTIEINASGNYRNLGIAPYEVVEVFIAETDTVSGKEIHGLYIPTSISWRYDAKNSYMLPSISLSRLVSGLPGDTVLIPAEVPEDGYEYPDLNFPPFPDIDIPPLAIYSPFEVSNVVMGIMDHGVYYTNDFDTPYPTWQPMNIGLPGLTADQIEVSATGKMYFQYNNASIWVSPYVGGTWNMLFDSDSVGNPGEYPFPRERRVSGFSIDRKADDTLVIFGSLIVTIFGETCLHMWAGGQDGVTLVPGTAASIHFEMEPSMRAAFVSRAEGGWLLSFYSTMNGKAQLISDAGAVVNNWDGVDGNHSLHTKSAQSRSVAFLPYHQYLTDDDGATWREISGSVLRYGQADPNLFQSVITNADGTQIVLGTYHTSVPSGLLYSLDGGGTWLTGVVDPNAIDGDVVGVTSVWHLEESAYVVSSYNNEVEGSTRIWVNYDLADVTGSIWVDKTGNLTDYITGTFYPTVIRHYYTND